MVEVSESTVGAEILHYEVVQFTVNELRFVPDTQKHIHPCHCNLHAFNNSSSKLSKMLADYNVRTMEDSSPVSKCRH